jgi:biotin synthase
MTADPRVNDILAIAREQVLEDGVPLDETQALAVLELPEEFLPDALALAHEVRMRWCGPAVEVEGIVSIKTGGCPEDCHFCSQSGRFHTPVRAVRLDIPALVTAAHQTAATGATEFCLVAAVRGPDERLMAQVREAVAAINAEVEINIACSLGILTKEQAEDLADLGVHRYNHNLETARSHFPAVVTTHTWEERMETLELVRELGMEVCCGGIIGMGESLSDRAELLRTLANLPEHPESVPINQLVAVPGTPLEGSAGVDPFDFVRTIAVARLLMPHAQVRLSAGRGAMSDELQALCFLAGANSIFYGDKLLTTGNPDVERDRRLFARLGLNAGDHEARRASA